MRRRGLTDQDRDAWTEYVRHVQALPGVPAPPIVSTIGPPPAMPPPVASPPVPAPVRLRGRPAPLELGAHPAGVDASTWTRFRTGKLPAARTLDLHGRTADRAHTALHAFIRGAHADGVRCVEVITGRGQRGGSEGGVIRREMPLWLNGTELRPMVLAAAHPHAANTGSVRLLLRRVRP